jgi:putative peptidoglycan lipid II flippase
MSSSPLKDDASSSPPFNSSEPSSHAPDRTGTTLARSAGVVSIATMASRILGLIRDQVLLITFGAGDRMDAFNVAFRLPNLVRDLFAEGAMSAAFVPTFTREMQRKGQAAAWDLGNLVISALAVATGIVALAGIVFAGPLTKLLAGGFAAVPGKLELTTQLTRVMFPFLVLVAVAVACMGMLNALRWFFLPALSPAIFNIAAILSVFLIVPLMPALGWDPMMGLAIGTLVGGLGQIAIQWPGLRREGFRFRFTLAPGDTRLREVVGLMIPGTLGLAAVQINQLVNMYLATGEGTGAVTYLGFAFRLMYLPIGLFGVSIATAALPAIARHVANTDVVGVRDAVSQALRLMLMLNVPATLGLVVLAVPIVDLLVGYRNVTRADTLGMAMALICYAPGLVGYSAVKIASPTFYALKDARTPVTVSLISIGVNIALNLTLVRFMSYRGLALGTGIAALVNAAILFWLLRRRLGGLDERRVALAFAKVMVASIVMAGAAWWTESSLSVIWPSPSAMTRAARVLLAVGVGLLTLVLTARLLRLRELGVAFDRVLARLRRR